MQSHPTTAPTVKTLQPYLGTILNYESVVCEQINALSAGVMILFLTKYDKWSIFTESITHSIAQVV